VGKGTIILMIVTQWHALVANGWVILTFSTCVPPRNDYRYIKLREKYSVRYSGTFLENFKVKEGRANTTWKRTAAVANYHFITLTI
jgi:hypothetical protein